VIVADASALFQVLGGASPGERIEARLFGRGEAIFAPHLVDAEIVSVLRRHVLAKQLAEARARAMLRDYLDISLTRLPHTPLLPRVFALRHTMTAYDALYVALAESLGATLVTRDGRLARAAEGVCAVEVFEQA
jgi:predicted nucleic acid-binding protein